MLKVYEIKEQMAAVFDPDSLKIWKIPAKEAKDPDIESLSAAALEARFGAPVNAPVLVPEEDVVGEDDFDTLILHISNCCNMQCEYCYESHSTYLSSPGKMTVETACRALDLYYSRYTFIREIKLFGGEPALNLPVIRAVGEHVEQLYADGRMRKKPVFKMITNGTIMTPELIGLIRRFQIKVVFSIDGDAFVHDQLRVYPRKKETFETIRRNFFILREATEDQQPYSINATYTGIHEQNNWSVDRIFCRIADLFPVRPQKINVHLVTAEPSLPYSIRGRNIMQGAAVDALMRAENGDPRTHTRLRAVIRRLKKGGLQTRSTCPAAVTWSAVSHNGNVYPCMMFIDRDDCFMGNVKDDLFSSDPFREVYGRFKAIRKCDHAQCGNCLARNVCASCMGINEFEAGRLYPRGDDSCREYRNIVAAAVMGIAEGVW